jgi:hypothetical protein
VVVLLLLLFESGIKESGIKESARLDWCKSGADMGLAPFLHGAGMVLGGSFTCGFWCLSQLFIDI